MNLNPLIFLINPQNFGDIICMTLLTLRLCIVPKCTAPVAHDHKFADYFRLEDAGSSLLRNFGTYVNKYTASHSTVEQFYLVY